MTFENSKRPYEHYVSIGYDKAADDLAAKYPEFKAAPKKAKEAPKKEEAEEEAKE